MRIDMPETRNQVPGKTSLRVVLRRAGLEG
jgi:hypothetical protein